MKYRYVIVGAGLAGVVAANCLSKKTKDKILVVEKRNHIAGNAYDTIDDAGVMIHQYGPHIFHTNDEEVFRYLSEYTSWIPYEHKVLSYVDGKYVPMPICIDTINTLYDLNLDEEGFLQFINERKIDIKEIKNSEDVVVSKVGYDIYEKLFKYYTMKQWGVEPKELDKSVISRIPFRNNHDTRYFHDTYQGMPSEGYTKMCERMLDMDNIEICLNTSFEDIRDQIEYDTLIYTGPIDAYYDYCFGKLLYRSLHFEFETYPYESYQINSVINYPNTEKYTRITEFKKLTQQKCDHTTIVKEYPSFNDEPFYPYPTKKWLDLYQQYEQLAKQEKNVIFLGRLAEYKYYNMDAVVKRVLEVVKGL